MRTLRSILRGAAFRLFNLLEGNNNADFRTNGELRFLSQCIDRSNWTFTMIDGGSARGEFAATVINLCTRHGIPYQIHLFEPSALLASHLRQRFINDPRVTVTAAALSDADRKATLFFDTPGSSLASLYRRRLPEAEPRSSERVAVMKLEGYLRKKRLTTVDFLKLDIEGNELYALKGLGTFLNPDHVRVIQFEYGGANLDSHTTLADLYALLEGAGYSIGKIRASGLDLRAYRPWMDNFQYSNYAAVSPGFLP